MCPSIEPLVSSSICRVSAWAGCWARQAVCLSGVQALRSLEWDVVIMISFLWYWWYGARGQILPNRGYSLVQESAVFVRAPHVRMPVPGKEFIDGLGGPEGGRILEMQDVKGGFEVRRHRGKSDRNPF